MRVGIEKLNLYAGRCCLSITELAQARQLDVAYVTNEIMCHTRSIYPPYEDAVTLAVNAAKRLLSPEDISEIELLIVGTESAVDMGKPISTWVHRFCGLSPNCRNFEVKHACYGLTGAIKMAASWVASGVRPGKKALVINSDLSPKALNTPHETALGGGAVAVLVSANPQLLELELDKAGYWTYEIADTFRPTYSVEIINDETSLFSYLDAIDGAVSHYEAVVGQLNYQTDFKKHIYHAPFPGMALQAHRTMLNRFARVTKKEARQNFEEKVAESLYFAKRIGSVYGGSTMLGLLGLLASATQLEAHDPISIFAYGSGCQSEFYQGLVGAEATTQVRALNIEAYLDERYPITVTQYEENESLRASYIGQAGCKLPLDCLDNLYERRYAGQGLLTLREVGADFQRVYAWS